MNHIDEAYRTTVRAAVREVAADVAFWNGEHDAGKAIYQNESRIADKVIERIANHYSQTRKAKTQRKVSR